MDYIYIDTQTSSSRPQVWGLRERLHKNSCQKTQQAKHISISQQVWNSMTTTPYATYETSILNSLLNNPPLPLPSVTQWMGQLSYAAYPDPAPSPAPSTPNAIAVLAILAHEIGHILWWDKNVGNRTCVKASQSRFSNYSWPSNQVAHGFHRLGQQDKQNRTTDRPDKDDVLLDFRYDNPPGSSNYPDAVADLQTMYLSGNWASLFATVSVDEDFIETYKLWILTNINNLGPITSLHINIPSLSAIDILSRFNNTKTKLYAKTHWIQKCLSWP